MMTRSNLKLRRLLLQSMVAQMLACACLLVEPPRVAAHGGGGGGSESSTCPHGNYWDQGAGGCTPCPADCADLRSRDAGNITEAGQLTRLGICYEKTECGGTGTTTGKKRHLFLVDMSSLEPVGLGTAAGVVCGLCLVAGAGFLWRRQRQKKRKQQQGNERQEEGQSEEQGPRADGEQESECDPLKSPEA